MLQASTSTRLEVVHSEAWGSSARLPAQETEALCQPTERILGNSCTCWPHTSLQNLSLPLQTCIFSPQRTLPKKGLLATRNTADTTESCKSPEAKESSCHWLMRMVLQYRFQPGEGSRGLYGCKLSRDRKWEAGMECTWWLRKDLLCLITHSANICKGPTVSWDFCQVLETQGWSSPAPMGTPAQCHPENGSGHSGCEINSLARTRLPLFFEFSLQINSEQKTVT